jgi:hypothetical protein
MRRWWIRLPNESTRNCPWAIIDFSFSIRRGKPARKSEGGAVSNTTLSFQPP